MQLYNFTMKIIISPAKKLDTCNNKLSKKMNFSLINEAQQLIDLLQKKTPKELKEIMGLSDNLTNLNVARFNEWDVNNLNTFNAILMFQGDVYKGLSAHAFSEKEMDFAQANLRILSGLYGILKPLDVILPYRLEMGTKIKNEFGNSLYDFWSGKLQAFLTNEMNQGDFLVNLAVEFAETQSRKTKAEAALTKVNRRIGASIIVAPEDGIITSLDVK